MPNVVKGVNNFWTKFKTMFRLVVSSNGPDGVLEVALPVGDGEDLNTSTFGVSQVTTNRSCTDEICCFKTYSLKVSYGIYPSMAYSDKSWVMSNASSVYSIQMAKKEPNNFQQLSKLIELTFISTTWIH